MAWIALEGMTFHAYHGVHEAEQVLGTEFRVSVYVKTSIAQAAADDDVTATVNYESIYQICRLEMDQPRKLIEAVVESIIKRLKHQFPKMEALKVRVQKAHPPVGGPVDWAWVEQEADFGSVCPRCKSSFLCYNDDSCWCKSLTNIHPATRETLERQFGKKCLCANCLKLYAG
ncbi:MAG TPA: dihydroneopterin aldolase [Saprospiraceae bacterium]|nr:dihydroneopterin aldolase [Saprospiraceae bacterium]HNG88622.1 dihydroneopterin aldolase [Saprospiraceae bacterium]